jgi:hypothetical protein
MSDNVNSRLTTIKIPADIIWWSFVTQISPLDNQVTDLSKRWNCFLENEGAIN